MGKKRWAAEVNDGQFEWLKELADEGRKAAGTDEFTGSSVIQELIEAARAEDRPRLVKRLVRSFLQRRVERLQTQLDTLVGEKEKKKRPLDDTIQAKVAEAE